MPIYKLDNVIKNYAWGSVSSFNSLFSIKNDNQEPQAELWMGAHTDGCSVLSETSELLSEKINKNPIGILGKSTFERFGELPFLFKVLAADSPLSIQVHPSKPQAEKGFIAENNLGISLDADNRNYKDPNHKPELIYALTPFKAMNGFRPIEQIVTLFKQLSINSLDQEVMTLSDNRTPNGLKCFFTELMQLTGDRKQKVLEELYGAHSRPAESELAKEVIEYSKLFSRHYDNDIGLLAPLVLNTIELKAGEAMFLHAETPHAYVRGTGLEIMANSNNVLRAGLTPKYIDVDELIINTCFDSISSQELKTVPLVSASETHFPIPVDDFNFEILYPKAKSITKNTHSAEILFCIEGKVSIKVGEKAMQLIAGESVMIPYNSMQYECSGSGEVARAYS